MNQNSGTFEPEKLEDHYETALIDLLNLNARRQDHQAEGRERRRSDGGAAAERGSGGRDGEGLQTRRGQKEMLMSIIGKKPTKEAAAKKPAARERHLKRRSIQ